MYCETHGSLGSFGQYVSPGRLVYIAGNVGTLVTSGSGGRVVGVRTTGIGSPMHSSYTTRPTVTLATPASAPSLQAQPASTLE